MPVCYDKLWKILIDKKMNRTDLKDMARTMQPTNLISVWMEHE